MRIRRADDDPGFAARAEFVLGVLVVVGLVHVVRPTGIVGDLTYVGATLGSATFAIYVARFGRGERRSAMIWIAGGLFCSGIGDVLYTVVTHIDGAVPDTSVADAFYLASYVVLGIGLLAMILPGHALRRFDVDDLIDLSSFAVIAMIIVGWSVHINDLFSDPNSPVLASAIHAAYPIMDAALVAVLLRAMFARRMLNVRGLVMALGIGCWLASDLATLAYADLDRYWRWLDLGWMLGALLMLVGVATTAAFTRSGGDDVVEARPPRSSSRVVSTLLPLLAPSAVGMWAILRGNESRPALLLVAFILLLALAILRSTRLILARAAVESALETSRRYFQALAENSADAVIVIDRAGRIVNECPQLALMTGSEVETTIGVDAVHFLAPVDADEVLAVIARSQTACGGVTTAEVRVGHPDGSLRWFALRVVSRIDDPCIAGVIVNIHDVTDRKGIESDLVHLAYHDTLTGLANRAAFVERLQESLLRAAGTSARVGVVYLDVDAFKTLNESRGQDVGDGALCAIARRIASAVRSGDVVARMGGDEFAILIETAEPLEQSIVTANTILGAFTAPLDLPGHRTVLSTSIGIAVNDAASTAPSMLRDADFAMYRAKAAGKARWALYEPQMRLAAVDRLLLEADLGTALERGELVLFHQPIVALHDRSIVGFEALLRWIHPTRGMVGPDAFIPLAEANGTIIGIGRWVLRNACATAAAWNRRHPGRQLSMAVNLSARQVVHPSVVDHVRTALFQSGLHPSLLVLEMTETVLVDDAGAAEDNLRRIRALGVRLAVDDFGTGYSSLSHLRQFPVDILKIDRSFVNTITVQNPDPAIVRGLLDLGTTLGLELVAEGIELEVQYDSLARHCRFGQGYLFSRPLSADQAEALLDESVRSLERMPTVGATS